jgi:hypothetical protein
MIEVKKLRDAVGLENCNSANKINTCVSYRAVFRIPRSTLGAAPFPSLCQLHFGISLM